MNARTPRPLALLVGAPSSQRDEASRLLIERGLSVVLCSGPPGCLLDHEDRCLLRDAADVTVLFGGRTPERFEACAACSVGTIITAGTHPAPMAIASAVCEAARKHEGRQT